MEESLMEARFQNQVVAVTGASSGVGRAIARAFGEEGAHVALLARNREALDIAAGEIRLSGGDALVIPVDVADAEAVDRAADQIVAEWGQIDIWVNCAMATILGFVDELTPEEYRRVTDVTYHGYVYGTLSALRHMRERDAGKIIQIGSAMAYRSIPLQSAYCGAKAAARAFTDSLRTELLHQSSNIELSQLQMPAINTPQPLRQRNKTGWLSQPVPPMFSPESMAETVLWAAERMPREMLIGWPSVRAVWAEKLFPGTADWWLSRDGVDGQLTDTPLDADRKDILFDVVPGDPGAQGPFVDRQRGPDWQMIVRKNLKIAGVGLGIALAGAVALLRR
jgi:NADP-dependent 3-hydroxy acid dehydrogenase YdfG